MEQFSIKKNAVVLHESENNEQKSAFLPYQQRNSSTVLTNLQRGNIEAVENEVDINFYGRAGQGEITDDEVKSLANVDVVDGNQLTALHWASYYGQLYSAQILIRYGANVNYLGPDFVSPLLLAASAGQYEIVKFLINNGANVHQMDIIGNTALMFAASGNYPHICNELLNHNARLLETNENNESAYSLSIKHGSRLAQTVFENFLAKNVQ